MEGVQLIIGDKCLAVLEAVGKVYPEEKYQRCTVYFYRNVFSVVSRTKMKLVTKMHGFPLQHWLLIRTNNAIECLNREIRRRTRVVGAFPDVNSALMLVCARLRHVADTQ